MSDDADRDRAAYVETGTGHQRSVVAWPAGPHYFDLTGSTGAVAWVRYRIWAAGWYTRTLQTVAGVDGNFDRLVGIEMALDGALNSLSGAFDAGLALLICGAEDALGLPTDDRTPVHRYSWGKARDLLKQPVIGTNLGGTSNEVVWRLILDVDNAMDGERDLTPAGWLAQLRRLRNKVAHQDSLARHHNTADGSTTVRLHGHDDIVEYLTSSCVALADLTEQMISLAIHIGAPKSLQAGSVHGGPPVSPDPQQT